MNYNEMQSYIEAVKKGGTGSNRKAYKNTTTGEDFTSGANGTISGYFATFDHDHGDSYGDVIAYGAFHNTIEKRKKTGHPFPLCFNHDFNTIIGRVTDIDEDRKGAYFTAEFFPTDEAQKVRNMVKSGVLWQFSFAYDTLRSGKVKATDGSTVNELREVELYEVSVVVVPANPRATLTDIKDNRGGIFYDGDYITGKTPQGATDPRARKLLNTLYEAEIAQTKAAKKHAAETMDGTRPRCEKGDAEVYRNELKRLREMETNALRDIAQAEKEYKTEWGARRKSALKAIRTSISRLEESLGK